MRKTSPLNGVLLSGKIYKWLVKKNSTVRNGTIFLRISRRYDNMN